MLLNFADDINRTRHVKSITGNAQSLINRRQVGIGKLYVHNRPDNLHDLTYITCVCIAVRSSHKICFSPLLPMLPMLMDCVATAPRRLAEDLGFGFEMIIACLKLRSCNRSPHSIADDFINAQLKEQSVSRGSRFGQRRIALIRPLWDCIAAKFQLGDVYDSLSSVAASRNAGAGRRRPNHFSSRSDSTE